MTSYGNSSRQELQSGQENPDGRTQRHGTVIVATNIHMEEKRTFEYLRKNIDGRGNCYKMFTTSMYWKGTNYAQQTKLMILII